MIRKLFAVMILVICASALSGCHTVKGVGEDVQSGGRAIERSTGQ